MNRSKLADRGVRIDRWGGRLEGRHGCTSPSTLKHGVQAAARWGVSGGRKEREGARGARGPSRSLCARTA